MAPLSGCYRILDGVSWTEHPVAPYYDLFPESDGTPHLHVIHIFVLDAGNLMYSHRSNSDETYIAGTWYLVVLGFRKSWTSNGQNLDFSTWRNQWFNKLFYRCFVPLLLIKPMELAVAENPRSSNNPPAVELRSEQRHFAPLPWPENPLSPRVVTTADSANGH